jgi:nucleotide-binding universal stress UspA family protein
MTVHAVRTTGPILVGVDGSAASQRALQWATVRATAGHTSLHIVHVVSSHVWLDAWGGTAYWVVEPREAAERLLAEAADSARDQAPLLAISTRLRGRDPASALLDEGRAAKLIVLGTSHRGRRTGWLRQSVTARVARRARGRVVLIGPDDEVLV